MPSRVPLRLPMLLSRAQATKHNITKHNKNGEEETQEGVAALNSAAGFLRSLLAKNISLRTTPKLKFIYDNSLVRGQYLTDLIDEALASDERDHHLNDDDQDLD